MKKHVWELMFIKNESFSYVLLGDPLILLLCGRVNGRFEQYPIQDNAPKGWVIGTLITTTDSQRILKASVLAKENGQWEWKSSEPGTRHSDYICWGERLLTVEAEKPMHKSTFAKQLKRLGWHKNPNPTKR